MPADKKRDLIVDDTDAKRFKPSDETAAARGGVSFPKEMVVVPKSWSCVGPRSGLWALLQGSSSQSDGSPSDRQAAWIWCLLSWSGSATRIPLLMQGLFFVRRRLALLLGAHGGSWFCSILQTRVTANQYNEYGPYGELLFFLMRSETDPIAAVPPRHVGGLGVFFLGERRGPCEWPQWPEAVPAYTSRAGLARSGPFFPPDIHAGSRFQHPEGTEKRVLSLSRVKSLPLRRDMTSGAPQFGTRNDGIDGTMSASVKLS